MIDEKVKKYVELCGGVQEADQLFQIYTNSYHFGVETDFVFSKQKVDEKSFINRAIDAGWGIKQINALLDLQKEKNKV